MTKVQFKHYYKSNISALQNFARKLTKNQSDADDLVQDTVVKAFRGMHTFKPGNSFKSWAFTILKNTYITKYNKHKRRNLTNIAVEDMSFAIDKSYTIKNGALSTMRIKEIKSCINDLSGKSKKPFLMYVKGYHYNEIAKTLEIPIGTVKSRINFARTKLKSILEDRGLHRAA